MFVGCVLREGKGVDVTLKIPVTFDGTLCIENTAFLVFLLLINGFGCSPFFIGR